MLYRCHECERLLHSEDCTKPFLGHTGELDILCCPTCEKPVSEVPPGRHTSAEDRLEYHELGGEA
jgi:hypothetical protein